MVLGKISHLTCSKVCSDIYGTVHYKEPLKLFDKSRALSPFFFRDIAMIVQKAT